MIYKVLDNGQIWIQFILSENTERERRLYEKILSNYGDFKYIEKDIIEFESTCFFEIPNAFRARSFVEEINSELETAKYIEA